MMLSAATTFMFKRAGMLSADGRCKALDKAGEWVAGAAKQDMACHEGK